ncbi:unnamed protein product, partial [Onchocerca ochengi]|uniref:Ribulose-1,5-bisphosphate carboxylase/oxygenase large subunit n=1 Tax=Onchocerca ochengi TaxID=42157 RepID=A0A182EWA0_ONCOC
RFDFNFEQILATNCMGQLLN